jgi:CRP-like cAMP-binding protein
VLLSLTYPRFRDFLIEFPEVMFRLLETVVWRLTDRERELFGDAVDS